MNFYEVKIEDIIEDMEPKSTDLSGFAFEPLDSLPLPPADGPGERGQDDSLPWPEGDQK